MDEDSPQVSDAGAASDAPGGAQAGNGRAAGEGNSAGNGRAAGDGTSSDGKADMQEVKRRFRAALDRKKTAHASESAAAAGREPGTVHSSHGPATSRRSFRRKSG